HRVADCLTQVSKRTSVFCLTPPPPTTALLPYTTLFRSIDFLAITWVGNPDFQPNAFVVAEVDSPAELGFDHRRYGLEDAHLDGLDRKSTRLNSSHVKTSYAVFCLKKKSSPCHNPVNTST